MKIKYFGLFLIVLLSANSVSAQSLDHYSVKFSPVFDGSDLTINNNYFHLDTHDSIMITNFKFYISGIEFIDKNEVVWKEKNSYHYIDVSNLKSLLITLDAPTNILYSQLKFYLGIDSTTNVSGAMGGDLDPTIGMYWTWQSGYINLKIEGKSNLCKTRNNEFEFHLGGYQYPFYGMQTIVLDCKNNSLINVKIDVKKMISGVDLQSVNQIMEPSLKAVNLAEKFSKCFLVQ